MPNHPPRRERRAKEESSQPKDYRGAKWGGVARRGAATAKRGVGAEQVDEREAPNHERDEWVREDGPSKRRRQRPEPVEPIEISEETMKEIERLASRRAPRLIRYMEEAAGAYAAERWRDVRRAMRPLLEEVPDAASVQELNGMVLYRTGKWKEALAALEAAHEASNSYAMHPAMMDCARALGRVEDVEVLWRDLREASPEAEVMAEGRIVYAATLADGGRLEEAIKTLEKAPSAKGRVQLHHLRIWYALADLHERSGDVARARRLFEQVAEHDNEMADVEQRIEALA